MYLISDLDLNERFAEVIFKLDPACLDDCLKFKTVRSPMLLVKVKEHMYILVTSKVWGYFLPVKELAS